MIEIAGNGPAPKPASQRARRNKDPLPSKSIVITPTSKPELPQFSISVANDGMISTQEFTWPEQTVTWWRMLDFHPLVGEFTDLDWSYLLDTARLHAAFWMGKIDLASELRLREAKYGFTPDDRLKLRWQVATTASAEVDAREKVERHVSSRDRYGKAKPTAELEPPVED